MYSSRFVAMWPPSTATGERSIPYYSPASDRDASSELDHALRHQLEVLRGRRCPSDPNRIRLHPPQQRARRRKLLEAPLGQRDEIVFAVSLQHQERRRGVATVDHQVRAFRPHREHLAGSEADFLLGIAEEDADLSIEDVEGVLDVVVIVPGHFLLRRDLNLVDPEAGALGMRGPPLDFVEMARVFHRFHDDPRIEIPGRPVYRPGGKVSCIASSTDFAE